ncbi:MAG: biopolymer transporter ExbD [Candidatus Electrothrix sp. LOE1_4_5]|nr:biopolymer transporter ExbD [Candidatus Electrothrix sp. AX1]MCI5117544.1 biopolymer transporter ExbD [Candidatus Electrothrix gigas]MCI5181383.1 biopolymer transporter ExbD [Candidatus Electrothrix gigas]MCI5191114.1 biopolymer transporter ExbD [Candidatus Electrothrix gigas]MCI5195530.1 biopolymer transporter ExbD [Candidatus Electrothrix gigas]
MKLSNRSITAPRVEMLPLIDIVFLLLVFFIYAMLSMAVHHGQQVDLPESGTAGLETTEAIGITIQDVGKGLKVFVDEKTVEMSELQRVLEQKKEASKNKKPNVQIFADKSVSYQGLFRVMDQVKNAGLTKISLQAEADK